MSRSDSSSRSARFLGGLREALRRYFVAGILVFAPIGVTIWATAWIVQRLDNALLPALLKILFPNVENPPHIPFLGALFTLAAILLLGVIARHFFGAELVRVSERVLSRVPVARSIYGGVKQLIEAIFQSRSRGGFRGVVLIEYPRRDCYAVAFTTGPARGLVQSAVPDTLVNCFVPTTPNPTSGFYLLIPEQDTIPVDMTVEDAFKLVMSGGLVTPAGMIARSESADPPALPLESGSGVLGEEAP